MIFLYFNEIFYFSEFIFKEHCPYGLLVNSARQSLVKIVAIVSEKFFLVSS